MNPWKIALVALLAASPRANALEWGRTRVDAVAQPEQASLTAEFPFRNPGPRPVTIRSIVTSCGCTTARCAKKVYGPGESGRVEAVFTVGGQNGDREKMITVATDEPGSAPAQLILAVKILSYAFVEPRLLSWKVGGDDSLRTIVCTARSDHAIELSRVTCSLDGIDMKVTEAEPGRRYVVSLRSRPRLERATARIVLSVKVEGVGSRTIDAYANFR